MVPKMRCCSSTLDLGLGYVLLRGGDLHVDVREGGGQGDLGAS